MCSLSTCSSDLVSIELCFQERLPFNLGPCECCCNM